VQLSRRQIIAYAAVAVVVVALGVRYVVLPKQSGASKGQAVVLAPATGSSEAASSGLGQTSGAATAAEPSPSTSPDVMVYVCGAVNSPGVVRLPAGARVTDALEIAGGPTGKAELAAVNLAAPVTDGQQIVVPEKGAAGAVAAAPASGSTSGGLGTAAAASGPAALVNINTASLEELDALDGVGPSTAQKIVDYRTANGGFKTIDEIKEVPGIGDAKFAAMQDSITV
jgi:competence protein ComEA